MTGRFDSSKMVAFRRRFPAEAIAEINEAIIQGAKSDTPQQPDEPQDPPACSNEHDENDPSPAENKGTLILDATCAPVNIHFPTDTGLLNKARESSEKLIDALWTPTPGEKKPRTYRHVARKHYLSLARNKRPGYRLIRKTIRKQLGYLKHNLSAIDELGSAKTLNDRQVEQLEALKDIFCQQQEMYDNRTHRIDHRIVSVHRPWARRIVRGKQVANTEFGAKIATGMEDGYSRIEQFSWEAFNEAKTLQKSCERYRDYPERILADKIYRNRDNLRYCKEREIRMNGPTLGRLPKDKELYEEQKRLERIKSRERNAIEGKYGEAKTRYGLNRVMTSRSDTSETDIHLVFVVMNLKKRLRDLFVFFFGRRPLSFSQSSLRLAYVGQ